MRADQLTDEQRAEIDAAICKAYQATFAGGMEAQSIVLEDLRNFCCGNSSCIVVRDGVGIDVHATIAAAARREVWLRLCTALQIDSHTGRKL